jgi:branched-chain amino acid transport system substrate-binding protein
MIRDKVVAVVVGASGVIENSWKILHGAHIPVVNLSSVSSSMLKDTASTFLLNDPAANTIAFPIGVAKDKGAKKISVIVVDLPPATEIFKAAKDEFTKNGIELQVVPAPLVTPDMTPQAQQVVSNNPDGLAFVVGNDEFCIPAFNGLHAVGFTGTISAISQCFTAATRKAVPGSVLNGMEFSSIAPAGEQSDPSQQQWQAILDTYAGGKHVDASGLPGYGMFQSFGALAVGSKTLQGEVTPASVIAALKGMKNEILPGSGNRWFRCNGKASQQSPAVCSVSVLAGTLDASGNPTTYKVVNNSQIPD